MPSTGAAGLASELKIDFLSLRCCAVLPLQAAHPPRLAAGRVQLYPQESACRDVRFGKAAMMADDGRL